MVSLQRGGRSRFILALLLLTAVTLATLDARGFGPVQAARGAALTVLTPFRATADWATAPVRSTWNGVWGYRQLEEENARLRAELEARAGQDFRETTARQTLDQVMTQADLTFAGDVPQVLARVVEGQVSNFEETVTIDKGSSDGIREGMTAVTGAGMVGRVERVTPNRSVIRLLTDPRMRVGVLLVSTGEHGWLEGRGRGRPPELVVLGTTPFVDGEPIQTSGLAASLYPPDLPIGWVGHIPEAPEADTDDGDEVEPEDGGGVRIPDLDTVRTERVEVELAADLDRLSYITVLLWEPSS